MERARSSTGVKTEVFRESWGGVGEFHPCPSNNAITRGGGGRSFFSVAPLRNGIGSSREVHSYVRRECAQQEPKRNKSSILEFDGGETQNYPSYPTL